MGCVVLQADGLKRNRNGVVFVEWKRKYESWGMNNSLEMRE